MRRILLSVLMMAALAACGSATEVGNPTTELPRTIVGMIDESTLPDLAAAIAKADAVGAGSLNVYAAATDGTSEEAAVGANGGFAIDVIVGKTYAFSVRLGTETIGDFSFEQNDQGGRGASLEIAAQGDDVDLGACLYEDGVFVPTNEPRRYQGINGGGGGGGGGAGYGQHS